MKVNMKKVIASAVVSTAFLMAAVAHAAPAEVRGVTAGKVDLSGALAPKAAKGSEMARKVEALQLDAKTKEIFEKGTSGLKQSVEYILGQVTEADLQNSTDMGRSAKLLVGVRVAATKVGATTVGQTGAVQTLVLAVESMSVSTLKNMIDNKDASEPRIAEVLGKYSQYVKGGMSKVDAMTKAIKEDQGFADAKQVEAAALKIATNIQGGCYVQ